MTRACSFSFRLTVLFTVILLLASSIQTGLSQVLCSSQRGCPSQDPDLQSTSVSECCAQTKAISFRPSFMSESCTACFTYGWVQNIAEDLNSAEPQETNITAVKGEVVPLTIFFTKNGAGNNLNFRFRIEASGTATEGTDYVVEHGELLISSSSNRPIPVNLTISNDQEMGEEEYVTLTLMNAISVNQYEILLYDRVTITIMDNSIVTGFSQREVFVKEGEEAEVCLETEGSPIANTVIDISIVPATADEKDLTLITEQIIITPSDPEPCVKFSATVEGDKDSNTVESLMLQLTGPGNVQLHNDSLTVFIEDVNGLNGRLMCSKESDCSSSFSSESVSDCCMAEGGLTYRNSSGTCSKCNIGLNGRLMCSKESDCSSSFSSESVSDCCMAESGLTYRNSSGICSKCNIANRSNPDPKETNDEENPSLLAIILPVVLILLLLIALLVAGIIILVVYKNRKNKTGIV